MHQGPLPPSHGAALAWGTVGWDGDGGTFYELGETSGDPNLLVRVTLFRGRDQSKVAQDGVAQGHQLLAKVASTFIQIPPRGSRVLVALGEPGAPGSSVILAADNPNPELIGNLKPGETGIASPQGKGRILFKKDNDAVVLYTEDDDGKSVQLYVGKDKIQLGNAVGSLTFDATNGLTLTAGSCSLTFALDGTTTLAGTLLNCFGQIASLAGLYATCLGEGCTPVPGVNNAIYGTSGMTGIPAVRVYIAPT